jgi:signal transduction histidine kinase
MKIYGISQEKFKYSLFKEIPLPQYRPILDAALKDLIEENKPYDLEFKIKTVDTGVIKDIHTVAVFEKEKRILLGVIQDITERKLAEDTLKTNYSILRIAGETAKFGGWSVDILENKVSWSDEVAVIHEMPRGYAPLLREAINYYAPEWRDKISKVFRECAETGVSYNEEMEILTPSGKRIWVRSTGEAVKDEKGKIVKVYGSFQDISCQKLTEEALKEHKKNLTELNTTKDKLLSIIAHDLRSPFNSILGFSELIIENITKYDVVRSEEYIKLIHSSAKHTLNLLDNLLDWAKSQTGQIDFNPENFLLQPIIEKVVNTLISSAIIKNISIDFFQSDKIVVCADQNMLRTILRNLITNAIKFTNSGGKISIYAVSKQDQIYITVEDNGVGMDNETINKLFSLSNPITTIGTAKERGTGLGLILCREFVERNGGKIMVVSEVGKGSRVTFTIPAVRS